MSYACSLFRPLTFIMSLMFAVFLVLDQFNPMMNFIDHDISRWLLAALCFSGIAQSVLQWMKGDKQHED